MKRRDFLKYSSLASTAFFVPQFLKDGSLIASGSEQNANKLIVIQLSGGNDSLNTIIPYRNELYYENRPGIAIKREEALMLTEEMGINPGMMGVKNLYDNGNICIVNSVGYPNPNRSHFRSMDIWHSASGSEKYLSDGWLGRYLDENCAGDCNRPHKIIELDDTLSLSMKGQRLKGLALREPERLYKNTNDKFIAALSESYSSKEVHSHDLVGYLHKTLVETTSSAKYIYDKSKIYTSKKEYPAHEFGKRMKTIAELIVSRSETSVYYISLSGFDTHIAQKGKHEKLLKIYSDSLKALCDELKENDVFNETMIMTFSEFGRRVQQNASAGTDHGAAGSVILAGGSLKSTGFYNSPPNLNELDEGDVSHEIDFRSIYATILEKWLQADTSKIIPDKFKLMTFA